MKQLNTYIIEKLKIDKEVNKKPDIPLIDRVTEIFEEIKNESNIKDYVTWYKIEENDNEIIIHLPDDSRFYLKQITDYLKEELSKNYKFNDITFRLATSVITIRL